MHTTLKCPAFFCKRISDNLIGRHLLTSSFSALVRREIIGNEIQCGKLIELKHLRSFADSSDRLFSNIL